MAMGAAAGGGRGRRRMGGMNEINVTPLIDVMLVLLVIFMVTAPLLTTGVSVDLPKVKSAPMETDDSKMMIIMRSDDHVYLGKDEITGDLDARREQRRGHHEDDEENEHDVDERRHVDVVHAALTATTASSAASSSTHRHGYTPPSLARADTSEANASMMSASSPTRRAK